MVLSIFISHIASESEIAIWIKKRIGGLLDGALEFFVSSDGEDIVGGDKWLDKILNALKKSGTVLVLCSGESVRRPWVNFEAGGAWMADKRVIPLCHSGMEPGKLPQPLATLQAYSLRDPQDVQRLVLLLAESAGVACPEFDAEALVQTLPPHEQAPTSPGALKSAEQRDSLTTPDIASTLHSVVDLSDYVFDKRAGIYRHKITQDAVCTSCLLEERVSPLSESPEGWRCHRNKCGRFFSNPDFDPPQPEPYNPMDYV